MPTIVRLQHCILRMYPYDHDPPHFHAVDKNDKEVMIDLRDLSVMRGGLDRRAMRELLDWAEANREGLWENWEYQQRGNE